MDTVDTGVRDVFLISLVLVILVYFIGFSTDITSAGNALTALINSATGRNAQGQFAAYPTGATLAK